jgi:hypothetical protein
VKITATFAAAVLLGSALSASDWPQFRGRDASGVAVAPSAPPTMWSMNPAKTIGW